ncbi:putative Solute carrier family 13 member 3 [Hypsibius exemplaris]|uniref:Solute carrier family 13 member 3 n=1 Tax=Hypsibius exemplaris TaxID=2072580 RepID=A0A1W0X823_HYPEX|nr:putative Solute carrier family 13 member 3 [Hypsibius exemplaris]
MVWINLLKSSWRFAVFFLTPLLVLPLPLMVGTKVAGTGYVLLVNIVYYITLPIPLCMATLLPIVLFPLLNVHPAPLVASWCFNDPTLMLIGGMIFAMAIEGAKLHLRIALKCLLLLGPRPERLLLAFITTSFLLSMWIANISVVVMLLPIITAIQTELLSNELSSAATTIEDKPDDNKRFPNKVKHMTAGMVLAAVFGSTMGGMTTLVGSHPPIVFKLVMDQLYGEAANVNFATYLMVCAPLAVSSAAITWLLMTVIYAPGYISHFWQRRTVSQNERRYEDNLMESFKKQYDQLGAINFVHQALSVGAAFLQPVYSYVTDGTVAMTVSLILFIWPTDIKLLWREGENIPLVQWRPHMTERFPWQLVFLTMGTNVLAAGSEAGGLADWIAEVIQVLEVIPPWVMMILISIFLSIITEFIGNSLIVMVFLPILAKFAERSLVNPIYYMLPATTCSMLSFMTPVASPLTALVHSTGLVTTRQMVLTGAVPKFICLLLTLLFVNTLGDVVFQKLKHASRTAMPPRRFKNCEFFTPTVSLRFCGFAKLESATSSRVISLGGSYESLAASMFEILHSFKWYHVAIVFEQKPVVSPWYEKVANAVLDNTVATSLPFVLEKYDVNVRSNQSLRAMMSLAKRRNRVFLLLTTGLTALNILNMAAESGMARGNFVFINVQSFQSMQYGSPLQFSHPYNDATEQAYRSLLFLVCRSDDALLTEENEAIADNSKDVYNFTDQDNDRPLQSMQVQFCFNAMEIFAVLVNETEGASCRDKGNDGLSLAGKMANRTFHLVTGDFTIDSLQARNADLSIFGFNVTTKTMQVVGSFFWYPKGHLVWSQDLHMDWATANSQPPLDVPVCGFSGQEGECATKAMFIIISALAASVASVLIFLILALLRRWHGGNQCVPCVWLDTASLQNMTAFSSDDIVKRSYEHYSERDYLSRVSFNAKI